MQVSQTQPATNEISYPDSSKAVGSSSKPVVGDRSPIPVPPPGVGPDAQRTTAACTIQRWYPPCEGTAVCPGAQLAAGEEEGAERKQSRGAAATAQRGNGCRNGQA